MPATERLLSLTERAPALHSTHRAVLQLIPVELLHSLPTLATTAFGVFRLLQVRFLFFSPQTSGCLTFLLIIQRFDSTYSGLVSTLAGNGSAGAIDATGTMAKFSNPYSIAIDPTGTYALVVDYNNHRIRSIVIASGAAVAHTRV